MMPPNGTSTEDSWHRRHSQNCPTDPVVGGRFRTQPLPDRDYWAVRMISTEISPPEPFLCSQASGWCSYPRATHSRPIVKNGSISVVRDRSLQYEDNAWSTYMVMNRAEDGSGLEREHTHSKLLPLHALDLRAKVNCCEVTPPSHPSSPVPPLHRSSCSPL